MISKFFRNSIVIVSIGMLLSACSGGVSGVMTSSGFGHWQIYRISYQPEVGRSLDQATDIILEEMFYNLGFERQYDWGKPFLIDAKVTTFKRKYKDRYIAIDVQISEKKIIIMSTSYSSYTEDIFNRLESALNDVFGEANIEQCYGTKDLNGHSCFQNY